MEEQKRDAGLKRVLVLDVTVPTVDSRKIFGFDREMQ
jgi:hypothetical protein